MAVSSFAPNQNMPIGHTYFLNTHISLISHASHKFKLMHLLQPLVQEMEKIHREAFSFPFSAKVEQNSIRCIIIVIIISYPPLPPPCISHSESMSAALVSDCLPSKWQTGVQGTIKHISKRMARILLEQLHGCSGEGGQLAGGQRGIWGLVLLLKCKYDGAAMGFQEWHGGEWIQGVTVSTDTWLAWTLKSGRKKEV